MAARERLWRPTDELELGTVPGRATSASLRACGVFFISGEWANRPAADFLGSASAAARKKNDLGGFWMDARDEFRRPAMADRNIAVIRIMAPPGFAQPSCRRRRLTMTARVTSIPTGSARDAEEALRA